MTVKDQGYEIDPDKMRQAIKLAEDMLEELENRNEQIAEMLDLPAAAADQVSTQYHAGQKVANRNSQLLTNQAYQQAFSAQVAYLNQLIPQLRNALTTYESMEQATADSMRDPGRQL
ncbi:MULTISPECIES: PE domain-containing protein [Thermocrispum]|jgi:hypothetical protein|nr:MULTISPECIES: PE domain-containing protein [Thermocrispum]